MTSVTFFCDVDKLVLQTSDQAFGYVVGSETFKYRVTSLFKTNGFAKAYAITDGKVFIQPQGGGRVNLVIKPSLYRNYLFQNLPVKYFIYRGLRLANFINNSNEIIPDTSVDKTDIISTLWNNYRILRTYDPSLPVQPSTNILGWNQNIESDNKTISEVFFAETEIELFNVKQNDYVGDFDGATKDCGFEIILEDQFYLPTLGYLRKSEYIIEVKEPTSSDIPGVENPKIIRDREEILNFIDPSAFFVSFHLNSVIKRDSGGDSEVVSGYNDIYKKIIYSFYTKNVVYLDIRNENGHSINFYRDNEGDDSSTSRYSHISISESNLPDSFLPKIYYNNYWPIYILELDPTPSEYKPIYIKFRNLYNPYPIVFLEYGGIFSPYGGAGIVTNSFWNEDEEKVVPADWSNPMAIAIPNAYDGSKLYQPSCYTKMYLIRNILPDSYPDTVFPRKNYADNIFGPFRPIPELYVNTKRYSWQASSGKRFIKNKFNEDAVTGMYKTYISVEDELVTFIAEPIAEFIPQQIKYNAEQKKIKDLPVSSYSNTYTTTGVLALPNIGTSKRKLIRFSRLVGGEYIFITAITNQSTRKYGDGYKVVLSFILTKKEYRDILSDPDFAMFEVNIHDVFIQFGKVVEKKDDMGAKYKTPILYLGGLDSNYKYIEALLLYDVNTQNKTHYNTIKAGNLPLGDAYSPYNLWEWIEEIKYIETIYTDNLHLDNTPEKTVTRLRVHHYGKSWEFDKATLKGIGFNRGVPYSPYWETQPGLIACPNEYKIPFAMDQAGPGDTCRIRRVYQSFGFKKEYIDHKKEDKEFTFDRFDKVQDVHLNLVVTDPITGLTKSFTNLIDFGHALYGLDCLINSERVNNLQPDTYLVNTHNIYYSIDFTSFIGDLASILTSAYLDKANRDPSQVTNLMLQQSFEEYFDTSDFYGDIEMFGYKKAWDEVIGTNNTNNLRLSDVLFHYYNPIIPPNQNMRPSHVSKRFTIFCRDNELIDSSGNWVANTGDVRFLEIATRVKAFAIFFGNITGGNWVLKTDMGINLVTGLKSGLLSVTDKTQYEWFFDSYSDADIYYVCNLFLSKVKNYYYNE